MNLAAIVLSTMLTSLTTPEPVIARTIIKSQRKSRMSKGVNSASRTSRTISSKTKTATLTSKMRKKGPTPCKPTMLSM